MVFTNSKGIKYYLSKKMVVIGRNKITAPVYFFRKEKKDDYCELPPGYKAKETRTGLPILKKI